MKQSEDDDRIDEELAPLRALARGAFVHPVEPAVRAHHLAAMFAEADRLHGSSTTDGATTGERANAERPADELAPRRPRRRARRAALAGGIAAATVLGTSALAAAGSLPAPLQSGVAALVRPVGIELPSPDQPADSGATTPGSEVAPTSTAVPPTAPAGPGASDDAPGHGGENPGKSDEAPGRVDNPGKSDEAPGHGGESPGKSDQAPGQVGTDPSDSTLPEEKAPPGQGDKPLNPGKGPADNNGQGKGPADPPKPADPPGKAKEQTNPPSAPTTVTAVTKAEKPKDGGK